MSDQHRTIVNDRYEIEQRVGRGGMADVFRATDRLLKRTVAIKVLFPEYATDPAFVERFRREAQSVAGLNHPNIVGVYDWGRSGNTYFMAMEYVEGRTLADILRQRERLTAEQASEIAAAVAGALGFAHRGGVVHRDVKPGNILIGSNGDIKVADFGIARAIDARHEAGLTQEGSVMGTATYFSPEQAQGLQPDPRSDLYSLGIVLYEMVAGKPPFVADSAVATAYMQVNDRPRPLRELAPDISRDFETIVAKCMAKSPDNRYQSADLLREDLRNFLEQKPLMAVADYQQRVAGDQPTTMMAPVGAAGADTTVIDFDNTNPRTAVMPAAEADGRRNLYAAAVAGVVAVAAIVAILVALLGGGGSSLVTVPNVVGDSIESATARLEELGLIVTPNPVPRDDIPPGEVYDQNPPEGTEVSDGDSVTVTFNPAPDPVPVPAVQTRSVAEATEILREAGFVLVVDSTREDDTLAPGLIIEQIPAAGQLLQPGEAVRVIVSGGAGQVVVPDVSGLTSAAAQAALRAAPYRFVVEVLEEPSATVARGNAVRTDPPVGSPVDAGRTIRLYISSGPQPVPVPDLEGEPEGVARGLLSEAQLGVDVRYTDLPDGDPNTGLVITQGTPANQLVPPGTVIVLTIGR